MFDLSQVNTRYFEVKLVVTDDTTGELQTLRLSINPSTVKTLKRFVALAKANPEEVTDDLVEAVRRLVSNNKQHKVVSTEYIEEMSVDEMMALIRAYMEWFGKEKSNDPN